VYFSYKCVDFDDNCAETAISVYFKLHSYRPFLHTYCQNLHVCQIKGTQQFYLSNLRGIEIIHIHQIVIMKKHHLIITTAYLLLNFVFSSSFISPQKSVFETKVTRDKKKCGPFEFYFTNPSGSPVSRITIYSDSHSQVFNNPSFPLTVPGAPFESGYYSIRVALSEDVTGSVRISDRFAGLITCEPFFNHSIPPIHFTAYCSWYDIEISPVDTCP
jgi:hypothetical protein